jgi:hypothetical protein
MLLQSWGNFFSRSLAQRTGPLRARLIADCCDQWYSLDTIAERVGVSVRSAKGILWHFARQR